MSVTIINNKLKVKDENGNYIGINAISDAATQEKIAAINAAGTTQINAITTQGETTRATIPSDYTVLSDDVDELKSTFSDEMLYKDTSVYVLAWRKGLNLSELGRYSSNHPDSVALLGGDNCPHVNAGTTFTVKTGYTISMAIWSEPLRASTDISKQLYLVRNVTAGTVTAPVSGYLALSIGNADSSSIDSATAAEDFAAEAVSSCAIYIRTVKTEIGAVGAKVDALYTTDNEAKYWNSGKWAVSNGASSLDSKVIKSKKYATVDYMRDALGIEAASGYEISVLCWGSNDTYYGSWNGSDFSKSSNTYFQKIMFADIGNTYKYAFNVHATNGDDITAAAYTNISFILPTYYRKVDTAQKIENAGKTLIVGDDGNVMPMRHKIERHTDLINAQKEIAEDWHLPFVNVADEMMLGANHQIPGTAKTWDSSGTTDLVQKNVWMSDGTHPYRGVGLVDMYGRAIANRIALVTPSYHDGSGEISPSYWAGKNLLWMGTSIPAGSDPEAGDGDGATYPSLVASQLGATVTNIAKGSSMLRVKSSAGVYGGIAYSRFLRAVTRMVSEADALANDWGNIYETIPNAPATLPAENLQTMKNLSFENLLLPYLDGTNAAPDAIVIDYGHNDTATGIDGGQDFWVQPTMEAISSGLLADDTWMTGDNYANLKLALDDDLSGITDLPAFAASLNRNCFRGACNFLITLILRYKPYMRIIMVSDYN